MGAPIVILGPDGRPARAVPTGPRWIGRSRRCQNCRHFESVVEDREKFLLHYTVTTALDRALRPDAAWKQWDAMARQGLLGVCRAGRSKADFIHAGALCDYWDGRVRFERGDRDELGDEARDRIGDPPEARGPQS